VPGWRQQVGWGWTKQAGGQPPQQQQQHWQQFEKRSGWKKPQKQRLLLRAGAGVDRAATRMHVAAKPAPHNHRQSLQQQRQFLLAALDSSRRNSQCCTCKQHQPVMLR
jgi:hypothetical protein